MISFVSFIPFGLGWAQRTEIFKLVFAGYGLSKVKAKYTERNREEKKTYNTKQTSKYLHTFRLFFFPARKQQITFIRNEYELKHVKTQIQFKFTLGIQYFLFLFHCGPFKFQSYTRTNMDRV